MKNLNITLVIFFMVAASGLSSQIDSIPSRDRTPKTIRLSIEPGIGIQPMPVSDLRLSNLIELRMSGHFQLVSYSYYTRHNAFRRRFNYVITDYSFSLSQMFGAGTCFSTKRGSHSISLVAGAKLESFKETLDHPGFERISGSSKALTPELALLYSGKQGKGRYFFSYRVYLPLSPYPLVTRDINATDGNLSNVSLEMGLGIRLK